MNMLSAIPRIRPVTLPFHAAPAMLETLFLITGRWQPPEQADTPMKAMFGAAAAGSEMERWLLAHARSVSASLVLVRDTNCARMTIDLAYNVWTSWVWHENLSLWLDGETGKAGLIPAESDAHSLYWTINDGDLIGDFVAPFTSNADRERGLAAADALFSHRMPGA